MHTQLIIGHVTDHSARIWVRGVGTQTHARVTLAHHSDPTVHEKDVELANVNFNTAVADFTDLTADTPYEVRVVFNNDPETLVKGTCSTFPRNDAPRISFLLSSCNLKHPSEIPFDFATEFEHREVFSQLHKYAHQRTACFMMHAGDQVYIDIAEPREHVTDENSYRTRYLDAWDNEPAAVFFGSVPNYMILDDHEIANEFHNGMQYPHQTASFYKEKGLIAYNEFQHSHNPKSHQGKYYYTFNCGQAQFFVMDVRTEKTDINMISPAQMEALFTWLMENPGKPKLIVTPVPFITRLDRDTPIGDIYGFKDKWDADHYLTQKKQILHFIFSRNIRKVMFLTGDVHAALHTQLECGDRTIHELIGGPMNQMIFNGSYMFKPNYTKTFRIDENGQEYSYRCRYSRKQQMGANVGIASEARKVATMDKYANTLFVTLNGDAVNFEWLKLHEPIPADPVLGRGSFMLT